eukprot:13043539-Heterocapsa_arctica.AAC.1
MCIRDRTFLLRWKTRAVLVFGTFHRWSTCALAMLFVSSSPISVSGDSRGENKHDSSRMGSTSRVPRACAPARRAS